MNIATTLPTHFLKAEGQPNNFWKMVYQLPRSAAGCNPPKIYTLKPNEWHLYDVAGVYSTINETKKQQHYFSVFGNFFDC